MKRKATPQSQHGPISAFAASKARARFAEVEKSPIPASPSRGNGEEPPLKKARSSPSIYTSSQIAPDQTEPSRRETRLSANTAPQGPVSPKQLVDGVDNFSALDRNEEARDSEPASADTQSEEDDEGTEFQADLSRTWEDFLLSKTRLTNDDIVYHTKDAVCFRMKLKSTFALIGQYDLWVRRGVVSILGAKLHQSSRLYRVYAPSTHSLPVIKCVSGGVEGCAEVEIRSCQNGLDRLGNLSDLYGRLWNDEGRSIPKMRLKCDANSTFSMLYSASDDPLQRHLRSLHLDKKWSFAIRGLSQRSHSLRVLTCGPKGSGKSTFNKYLLNHLLSAPPSSKGGDAYHPGENGVAFLELDPGQPEFLIPGHIYLAHIRTPALGPSFSHPTLYEKNTDSDSNSSIVRSHYIGASSPKDDLDYYHEAITDLMAHFQQLLQHYPTCPLIINYPGWIFGQGLEIVASLIMSLGLSDLVYMSEKGPEEVVATLGAATAQHRVLMTILPSQPIDYVSRSSSQLRSMQMLSYFHSSKILGRPNPVWSDIPLSRSQSYVVSYSSKEKQGIRFITAPGFPCEPDMLCNLLDGAIVGVVVLENCDAFLDSLEDRALRGHITDGDEGDQPTDVVSAAYTKIQHTKENLPYLFTGNGICVPPDPRLSHSLGAAIVRSINTDAQTLNLITPIPTSTIRKALSGGQQLILVRGQMESPNWAIGEEYFAARAAQERHRRVMGLHRTQRTRESNDNSNNKNSSNKSKPESSRPVENDSSAREAADCSLAAKLSERVRRAGSLPWMQPLSWDHEGDGKAQSRRRDRRLWNLRKRADYDLRDSAVESG